ncbi:hypothetical protein [Mongoliibacter ruber]|uniref:Lipoprotein n=1 Tax=Mongoliibacter ruber TaxID=1750599 RepID=A0A2T0WIM9_9BACT|nr:hypothetical protein [Mongoliibacter ruber]PRY86559.1 hypothetical protein CLW00_10846 [Mongoliibacter ruber]
MFKPSRTSLILFLGIVLLFSCKTIRTVESPINDLSTSCYKHILDYKPESKPESLELDSFSETSRAEFSENSLFFIQILGISAEIEYILNKDFDDELHQFKNLQKAINQITLSELEVKAFSSALRCEEDKFEQLAWHIETLGSNTRSQKTVTGIIIDASANLAGAAIILFLAGGNTTRQLIGVGASLTQIYLNVWGKSITYNVEINHEVNVLEEFSKDQEWCKSIPDNIWAYVNYIDRERNGSTIREELMDTWAETEIEKDKSLYFSSGGTYTSEQLRNRASMLEQLASLTEGMLQDLLILRKELQALDIH